MRCRTRMNVRRWLREVWIYEEFSIEVEEIIDLGERALGTTRWHATPVSPRVVHRRPVLPGAKLLVSRRGTRRRGASKTCQNLEAGRCSRHRPAVDATESRHAGHP